MKSLKLLHSPIYAQIGRREGNLDGGTKAGRAFCTIWFVAIFCLLIEDKFGKGLFGAFGCDDP